MTHSRSLIPPMGVAAGVVSAVALAACGGSGGSSPAYAPGGGTGTGAPPPATASSGTPAGSAGGASSTIRVASSSLGSILVNAQGRTLYLFKADSGTKSTCSGACASAWPPLRVTGKPVAGPGTSAVKLGTTTRSDGGPQVTYNGHPLYTYEGDTRPDDVTGQGLTAFGAAWFVLSPSGAQISGHQ